MPNGYESVDSIRANGAQYVDTGIAGQPGLRAEVSFMYTRNVTRCVLGASAPSGEMRLPTPAHAAINRCYEVETAFAESAGSRTLYLFANNADGTANDFAFAAVFSARLYVGETLVADFVPCRETASGDLGLYDTVAGKFRPSQGSKPFFRPLRVGVYGGPGGVGSAAEYCRLIDRSPEMEFRSVTLEDAKKGDVFGEVDAILVPGGSSQTMFNTLMTVGQSNIKKFVKNGGLYFGTCAGTHLVLHDQLNISGYRYLGKVNDTHLSLDVALTEEGQTALDLPKSLYDPYYSISPVLTNGTAVAGADVHVWGRYANTDLKTSGDGIPMAGKPCILAGSYYDGKLFCIAPHPEIYVRNYPIVRQGFRWLADRDDITLETEQLNSSGTSESGRTNVFFCTTYDSAGIGPAAMTMVRIDADPRLNLVKISSSAFANGASYLPTARAFIAVGGSDAAAYHMDTCKTRINTLKRQGGLVLFAEDGLSDDDIWNLVDALASDTRTETSCVWEAGNVQTFAGDRTLTGLDLRTTASGDYTTTFSDGVTTFAANERGLGGDWAYCGDSVAHTVRISNARVRAVYGNHRRNSYCTVTSDGVYTSLAKNRFEITLGDRNEADGEAVLSFDRGFAVTAGSTLSIDARGKENGVYKIIKAGSLKIDDGSFLSAATFTLDSGKAPVLSLESNVVQLEIRDRPPVEEGKVYEVDWIETTGTQYIDTGLKMQDKLTLDIDYQYTRDLTAFGVLCGGYSGSPVSRCYLGYTTYQFVWRARTANSTAFVDIGHPQAQPNVRYRLEQSINGKTVTSTLNGTTKTVTCSMAQDTQDHPVFLFGYCGESGNLAGAVPVRCYGAKLYTNAVAAASRVLAHDYRPACRYREAGSEYGLYDLVTRTFVPSAGGEAFLGATLSAHPRPADPDERTGLPGWLVAVDYVESTGSQYIDTGLTMQDKLTLDATFDLTAVPNDHGVIFGSYNDAGTTCRYYFGYIRAATMAWRTAIGTGSLTDVPSVPAAKVNARYHLTETVNGKRMITTLNDVGPVTNTFTASQTAYPYTCYLFAHRSNSSVSGCAPIRLYSARIYTDSTGVGTGTLARDYVPVYRPESKQFGLFDRVNWTFQTSESGEFLGPRLPEDPDDPSGPGVPTDDFVQVDYVQSTGGQYVNTGLLMQDRVTMDADFELTSVPGDYAVLYGGYLSSGPYRYYMGYAHSSGKWRAAFGSNSLTDISGLTAAKDVRYHFVQTINGKTAQTTLNGTAVTTTFSTAQTTQSQTCYLFAQHSGSSFAGAIAAKFYGAKIYTNSTDVSNGVLARDYRPCWQKSTQSYGVYEVVTQTFCPSATAKAFLGAELPSAYPTVNGETVEPGEVFKTATSARPIVYPSAVTVRGEPGGQVIVFGETETAVPAHYTASVSTDGLTVILVLNDNAQPVLAADETTDPPTEPFAFEGGKVTIHIGNVIPSLYYALGFTADLGGAWQTNDYRKGAADFEDTPPVDAAQRFYRVFTTDAP